MLKHSFPSRHTGAASDPCVGVGCLGRGWGGCIAPMPGEPSFSAGTRNLTAVLAAPYCPCNSQGRQHALWKQINPCLDEEKDRGFLNFISTRCSWSSLIPSHPLCFQSSCNSDSCPSPLPTFENYQVNIQLKLRATVDYAWTGLHHSNKTKISFSWNDIIDAVFLLRKGQAYRSVIW